jgi:RNA polymerase sigma factor (sigma-70 family)
MNGVLRHLRRAALLSVGNGLSDAQLLESFLARREEAAFEALLRRHGPMVLGVCRRVLRNTHDAEDAFQATFLVLARQAGSIRSRQVVASWLYGVAYRTAMKARAMNAKRRAKERQAADMSRPAGEAREELLEQLDHELNRLPDKYRVPIVLCELEGRSRKEVARLLGLPEGTLSWRLAHAKKILARRLSRYGTVAVAALLAEGAASACLTPTLRTSTIKAALTAGAVPAKVLALTEGVVKAMLLTKLKITFCFGALMLLTGLGATGLTYRATAQQPKQGVAQASRPQADELEALRLEIEALRKELRATKERVKALEARGGRPQGQAAEPFHDKATTAPVAQPRPLDRAPTDAPITQPRPLHRATTNRPITTGADTGLNKAADPLSEAEAALKKLRENPGDREATKALERALRLLKEREKPRPAADDYRREKQ